MFITDPTPNVITLARYTIDGVIDSTFGNQGSLRITINSYQEYTSSLVIQDDNKIVILGKSNGDFAFARLNTNGTLDKTFGEGGRQITDVSGGSDGINDGAIFHNKLYVAGEGDLGGVVARYLLDNKINTPPTVSLTAPANNTTYLAPANPKLSAVASEADGSISKVEFYNGTTLLHTETVAPYGFKWRNLPAGNYTISAKAYDNRGLTATSAPVRISVVPNNPPAVSIIKPSNNQSFAAPGYLRLEADAKDIDGKIVRVEFYNGSTLLRTEYSAPYTYHWQNIPVGTYTITAVAVDSWGAHTNSAPVTIRIKSAVIVSNKSSSNNINADRNALVSLKIAPNPVEKMLTIYTNGLQKDKPLTLSVVSTSGALIKMMHLNTSVKTIKMDVSSMVKGVYTIKLMDGNKVLTKEFVKL